MNEDPELRVFVPRGCAILLQGRPVRAKGTARRLTVRALYQCVTGPVVLRFASRQTLSIAFASWSPACARHSADASNDTTASAFLDHMVRTVTTTSSRRARPTRAVGKIDLGAVVVAGVLLDSDGVAWDNVAPCEQPHVAKVIRQDT